MSVNVNRRDFLRLLVGTAAAAAVLPKLVHDAAARLPSAAEMNEGWIAYSHPDAYDDLVALPEGEIGTFYGFRIERMDRDELARRYPPRDMLLLDLPKPRRRRRDSRGAQWKWERLPHHQRWA